MISRLIFTLFTIILLSLFASCNKEVSTSPPEIKPENSGKLYVDSNPKGALIFLNGKNTGYKTPDTVPYLNEGSYNLKLKLNLYKDSTEIVSLSKDQTTSIFFDYISNPTMRGQIQVDSNPREAEIIINDSAVGMITPSTINNLLPGYYQVTLKKVGFWNKTMDVVVSSNKTARINTSLTDTSLWVTYNSSHSSIPSDFLYHVVTENGVKWIASLNGLIKFDDVNWTVFTTDNSPLPSNLIRYVTVDGRGNKWICTNKGLVVLSNNQWTVYNSTNSPLPGDDINYVGIELNGDKWICTKNKGIVKYDAINWTVYDTSNSGLPTNNINSVAFTQDYVWIATLNGGMVRYDRQSGWKIFNKENTGIPLPNPPGGTEGGLPSNNIYTIAIDKFGNLWLGMGNMISLPGGTAYYKGFGSWDFYDRTPSEVIFKIVIDNNNVKWFANQDAGLSKYDGAWKTYNTSNSGIGSNKVYSLSIDENGVKWIATFGGGLVKYKGN